MGTSKKSRRSGECVRDHPHACGDKSCLVNSSRIDSGSSPRVWGQVRSLRTSRRLFSIIPTRVGTSLPPCCSRAGYWDHPHACGDKNSVISLFHESLGSSPRVWGQGYSVLTSTREPRIIPTRVGTSKSANIIIFVHKDHPHACGDKETIANIIKVARGSSPRVWGQEHRNFKRWI